MPDKKFTPAERIAELNEIDKSTAALLKCAGQAIQILASDASSSGNRATLESQKEAFTKHSSDYFATLSSIEVRLRRQAYALEEVGLIAPGQEKDAKRGKVIGSEDGARQAGGGPLDSSWLNARANDTVRYGTEKELWAQARELVEKLQHEKSANGDMSRVEQEVEEDAKMDVDKDTD